MDRTENITPPGRFLFGLPLALEVPTVSRPCNRLSELKEGAHCLVFAAPLGFSS